MSIIDIIKEDEGCRLKPYTDTTGHITIGYGRNLSACGISKEEAEFFLKSNGNKNSKCNLLPQLYYPNIKFDICAKEAKDILSECKLAILYPILINSSNIHIGYNRDLTKFGITQEEAEFLFRNDYNEKKFLLNKAIPWVASKPQGVQDALLNMAFNVGVAGLLKFTRFLHALQNDRIIEALDALKFNADNTRTKYYTQVPARVESICDILKGKK